MSVADLNQLRTFVELYELRSVTAVAERLHVTQPTVSYTLRKLRERFDDDLFRREGNGMVPTAKATQLFGPLHEALAQIDATVNETEPFNPAKFSGELVLGLTSIGEQTFLPPILRALEREQARLHLQVLRLDSDQVAEQLSRGLVDLALTVSMITDPGIWRSHVRGVEYVAVTSKEHPLPATGPNMFKGRRFVRVSSRGGHIFPLQALTDHGLMPQVALTVEEYGTVPAVLEASNLVVFMPRHVAEVFVGWFNGLAIADLPWPGDSTPVALYTRREASLTPVQSWFRSLVHHAVAEHPPA